MMIKAPDTDTLRHITTLHFQEESRKLPTSGMYIKQWGGGFFWKGCRLP